MASGGKKKTTMAKLNRERKMRERRLDKAARKEARKLAAADGTDPAVDELTGEEIVGEEIVGEEVAADVTAEEPTVEGPPTEGDMSHAGRRR